MKTKFKSLLLLAVLVPFFFSCNNDDDNNGGPTITFDKSSSSSQVSEDGTLVIKGSITSKEGTSIESVIVKCLYGNGSSAEVTSSLKDLTEGTGKNSYTFLFTEATRGIKDHLEDITGVQITATVKNGDENTQKWSITPYQKGSENTPLGTATDFSWARISGAAGTGLDQFGLTWTSNGGTPTHAIVKKDAATKFVELDKGTWASIKTQEELAAAITAADAITEYTGFSTNATTDYDVVLAVRYDGVDYILHVTKSTVATSGDTTITGQYKK